MVISYLLLLLALGGLLFTSLLLTLALLQQGLRNEDLVLGRDGPVRTERGRRSAYSVRLEV